VLDGCEAVPQYLYPGRFYINGGSLIPGGRALEGVFKAIMFARMEG